MMYWGIIPGAILEGDKKHELWDTLPADTTGYHHFLTMTTKVKATGTKDFMIPVPHPPVGGRTMTGVETPPVEDPNVPAEELWPTKKESRVRRMWNGARETWKGNVGWLLVAGSQAFFSLMNVSVKKLNSIDPPVSALQVCESIYASGSQR